MIKHGHLADLVASPSTLWCRFQLQKKHLRNVASTHKNSPRAKNISTKKTLHHFTAPQKKKHSKTQQPKNTFKQKQTSRQPKTPPPHPLPPKKTCIYCLSHLISSARADRPIPLKLEARIIDLEGCASTSLAVSQWGWSRKTNFF